MNQSPFSPGDHVVAAYKTGEYIAEVLEVTPPKALLKILAVVKHPDQGDLHNPMQTDVAIFHQRRALSYQEKVMVMLTHLRAYRGQVPEYRVSLEQALDQEIRALKQSIKWAERALLEYAQLEKDYFPERKGNQA